MFSSNLANVSATLVARVWNQDVWSVSSGLYSDLVRRCSFDFLPASSVLRCRLSQNSSSSSAPALACYIHTSIYLPVPATWKFAVAILISLPPPSKELCTRAHQCRWRFASIHIIPIASMYDPPAFLPHCCRNDAERPLQQGRSMRVCSRREHQPRRGRGSQNSVQKLSGKERETAKPCRLKAHITSRHRSVCVAFMEVQRLFQGRVKRRSLGA